MTGPAGSELCWLWRPKPEREGQWGRGSNGSSKKGGLYVMVGR